MTTNLTNSQKNIVRLAIKIRDDIRTLINDEYNVKFIYKDVENLPLFGCAKTVNSLILYITNEGPLSILSPIGKIIVLGFVPDRRIIMQEEIKKILVEKYGLVKINEASETVYNSGYIITKYLDKDVPMDISLNKFNSKYNWLKYYKIWKKL